MLGFGDELIVVAVGPGIHEGRSTMILSGLESDTFQRWLDSEDPSPRRPDDGDGRDRRPP